MKTATHKRRLLVYLLSGLMTVLASQTLAGTKDSAWQNYDKATELFARAAPAEEILALCKQALEQTEAPSLYARTSFLKARVLVREKRYAAAHKTFAEIYSGTRSLPEVIRLEAKLRDARLYQQERQNEAALSLLRDVAAASEHPVIQQEARVALAWEVAERLDWNACDSLLTHVVQDQEAYERDERILVLRARIQMAQNQPESAIEILQGSRSKLALTYLAKAFEQAGKPIMAVGAHNTLSDLFPDSDVAEKALLHASDVFMRAEDWLAARSQFNRLLQRYPQTRHHSEVHFRLGWLHLQLGQYEQALNAFAAAGTPANRDYVTFMEAECLRKMGDADPQKLQEALLKYNSVTALFPNSPLAALATLRSALTMFERGDTSNATVSLRQFLSLHSKDELAPAATFLLATRSGPDKSSQYFEEILQKYPHGIVFDAALVGLQKLDYEERAYQNVINRKTNFQTNASSGPTNDYQRLHHLLLAESAYYLKQYELANKHYAAAGNDSKDDLSQKAALGQAWCQLQSGQPEQAALAFETLTKTITSENQRRAAFGLATAYFRMQQYQEAIRTYPVRNEKISDPERRQMFAKSLYRIGESYYRLQYYAQAIETWEQLGEQYPESTLAPEAQLKIADTYFRANHYEEAIAVHQDILQNYAATPYARKSLLQLAQCEYNAGDYEAAITHFEDFLMTYPEDAQRKDALSGLQLGYYQLGQGDQASEALQKLIAQSPNSTLSADARFQLAMNHLTEENYAAAIQTFKEILTLFPESSYAMDAQFALAKAYNEKGDYEKATQEFSRFIQYFSEGSQIPEAVFNIGIGFFNLESYLSASDYFQRVLEQHPKSEFYPAALQNLGWCYERLGEPERAAEYFEQYLREFPKAEDVANIKLQAARINAESGNLAKARPALQSLQKHPDPAIATEAAYHLGIAYLDASDLGAAKQSFRSAIQRGSADGFYRIHAMSQLAALYESEQDWKNAVAMYQMIVDSTTDETWTAAAQERIKALKPFVSGSTARATN